MQSEVLSLHFERIKPMTSEKALRRMRQRIFDYPKHKQDQADRVLVYLKARMMRERKRQPDTEKRGFYSGLTRSELARTGTCETDWF
jgi:hypothetical protein